MAAGSNQIHFTVFTKPWPDKSLAELGRFVKDLGFDGIELPARPGFQVEPETITKGLPEAAKILADCGVQIGSVAGPTDEMTIAACAEAGVPVIRICVAIPDDTDYLSAIADLQREWDGLVPALDRHGVTLGIQNHCGRCIANAMQLHHAIGKYDPKHVAAVWDAAHTALDGEIPELALDIVWSHLCIVNLKNAIYRNTAVPDAQQADWSTYWTSGSQGLADWVHVANLLRQRGWTGNVCLTAEYSDHGAVDKLIAQDIAFAKSCFA